MPSPFSDGGRTRTIDIPKIAPEPPRRQSSLPWIVVGVVTLILLAMLALAVISLSS